MNDGACVYVVVSPTGKAIKAFRDHESAFWLAGMATSQMSGNHRVMVAIGEDASHGYYSVVRVPFAEAAEGCP